MESLLEGKVMRQTHLIVKPFHILLGNIKISCATSDFSITILHYVSHFWHRVNDFIQSTIIQKDNFCHTYHFKDKYRLIFVTGHSSRKLTVHKWKKTFLLSLKPKLGKLINLRKKQMVQVFMSLIRRRLEKVMSFQL